MPASRTHLALVLALALAAATGPVAAASAGYRAYATGLLARLPAGLVLRPDLEAYLSHLASAERVKRGLTPLSPRTLLRPPARTQAADMALGDYVGHHSRKGYSFARRFTAFAGARFGHRGENAARERGPGNPGKAKARRLFRQWLSSGGHRRNLLAPHYAHVSTGVVQKGRDLYAVQIFWEADGTAARYKPGSPQCLFASCPKGE